MVREEGPEWGHVTTVEKKKDKDNLECRYCKLSLMAMPPASGSIFCIRMQPWCKKVHS